RTVDDTYARLSMRMGPNGNNSYEKKKIVGSACRSGMLLAGRGGRISPKCTIQPDGYLPGGLDCALWADAPPAASKKCTIQPDGYLPGGFRRLTTPVADQPARRVGNRQVGL